MRLQLRQINRDHSYFLLFFSIFVAKNKEEEATRSLDRQCNRGYVTRSPPLPPPLFSASFFIRCSRRSLADTT